MSFHAPVLSALDPPTNSSSSSVQAPGFSSVIMWLMCTAVFGGIIQGGFPRKALKKIPQPILVMICAMLLGVFMRLGIPNVGESVNAIVDPVAVQVLFLPVLMFEELFRMNTRAFTIVFGQLLWLIGPGVIFGCFATGVFPLFIMPSDKFSPNLSFAFGGMLATTDPIAVIMTINELAAPKRLAAVVGGESLLNDGMSIILVELFLHLNAGDEVEPGNVAFFCVNQMFFSWMFGSCIGFAVLGILRVLRSDFYAVTAIIIAAPFITFASATYYLKSSGVLAMIPVGYILNEFGRPIIVEHIEHVESFISNLSFVAMTWLYALTGLIAGISLAEHEIVGVDWASMILLYIWINLVRFGMIFMSMPLLVRTGYGFTAREGVLLAWGGLRGAVGLTLAIAIKNNKHVSKRDGDVIQFFMSGMVMLMLINGVTAGALLKALKLGMSPNEQTIEALRQKMSERCLDTLEAASISKRRAKLLSFGPHHVHSQEFHRSIITAVQNENDRMPHRLTKELVSTTLLKEQRRHLILAQRQIYEKLLRRGLINRGAWKLLDRAADLQLELNHFHLDQFSFVVQFATKTVNRAACFQPNFFTKTKEGKLLKLLLDGQMERNMVERELEEVEEKTAQLNCENKNEDAERDVEVGGFGVRKRMGSSQNSSIRKNGSFGKKTHVEMADVSKSNGYGMGAADDETSEGRPKPARFVSFSPVNEVDHLDDPAIPDGVVDKPAEMAPDKKASGNEGSARGSMGKEGLWGKVSGSIRNWTVGSDRKLEVERIPSSDVVFSADVSAAEHKGEDDDDEDDVWFAGLTEKSEKRNIGISLSPEQWALNFTFASWGFLLTQQQSELAIDEMFTVAEDFQAFVAERAALKKEVQFGCDLPALYLDAIGLYLPHVLVKVKRAHLLSQSSDKLFGTIAQLNGSGMLERMDLKRLLKHADQALDRIRGFEGLDVEEPITVGRQGFMLRDNPNYFPFVKRMTEKDRMKEATNAKKIERRHSFSDMDSLLAELPIEQPSVGFGSLMAAGSKRSSIRSSSRRSMRGANQSRRNLVDRKDEMDLRKLMDVSRMDDFDLKKF